MQNDNFFTISIIRQDSDTYIRFKKLITVI